MRRAVRILFHLAAGVSGVFFFVAAGFWIASYGSFYRLDGGTAPYWAVGASRGEMKVSSVNFHGEPGGWGSAWSWVKDPDDDLAVESDLVFPPGGRPVAGFLFQRPYLEGVTGFRLLLPMPFVVALFALLPLAEIILIRRRRRRTRRLAAGLCVACGYDLRASPDRCPECGAIPAAINSV